MKLLMKRKLEILIFMIMFIISSYLIYSNSIVNGEISIKYKSNKEGSLQLFYDNHNMNEAPFDETHSITTKLDNTKNDFKTVNIPISLKDGNRIRIDIDGIDEKVELDKIYLSAIGIRVKGFTENDISKQFNILNDGEWSFDNNILAVKAKGNDLFFINNNVGIQFKFIKVISVVISFIFWLIVFKMWIMLGVKLNISNIKPKLLIAIFIISLIIPSLEYKLSGKSLEPSTENRSLKTKPSLTINNIMSYPKEYEEYYNDNLAFKSELVRLNSVIKYEIFNTSSAKYVIKGNDGWLFYNSKYKSDADTLGDYQHTNRYAQNQLADIKQSLEDKEKFLKEKGIEMYVFIPPNKSQVYSEFMLSKYKKLDGNSKIEELINYLRENTDITVIDPKEKLLDNKSKYQLYYKLDTHWNSLGGYIGYTELMKNIDKNFKYKDLNELDIESKNIQTGDLANMINLSGRLSDTQYNISNFNNDVNTTLVEQKENNELRYVSTNLNGKKLLCFRDSFSTSVIPYLSKEFQESLFLWGVPYSKEIIEKEKPDIVVFESAERIASFN